MKAMRSHSTLLIVGSLLLTGIFGCPELITPPESVLEGTWELVPNVPFNPKLEHLYLTFDSSGDLAQVRYTFVDLTTVTWDYPPGTISVDGDQIHISTTKSGNGLTFDGTLDSATTPTQAAGRVNSNLIFSDIHVTVSQGDATLVKQ